LDEYDDSTENNYPDSVKLIKCSMELDYNILEEIKLMGALDIIVSQLLDNIWRNINENYNYLYIDRFPSIGIYKKTMKSKVEIIGIGLGFKSREKVKRNE